MNIANRHRIKNAATVARRMLGVPRRNRQRGQALLWFLATIAACCAMLALVYNVGQVTNEKEKTINAADAAALSGALVEARMLNFMAYTNRAMIADEVTIAQIVSLSSWVRYDSQLLQNASDIPIVGEFIAPFATALQTFVDVGLPGIEEGVQATDMLVNQVLQNERSLANTVAVQAASDVASQVAQANHTSDQIDVPPQVVDDNGFKAAALGLNEAAWVDFTKDYTGNDRGNAAQVVLDSRDQFSTYRGLGHMFDPLQYAVVTGVDKTSGATRLADYDHWEAEDSADVWVGVSFLGFNFKQYILPIGWGRADANQNGDTGGDWDFGGGPCTQFFVLGCELAYQSDHGISGFSGIPDILDLKNPGSASNDPSLPFVVAVKKSAQATYTTQHIGSGMNTVQVAGPLGSPDLKDNLLDSRDELAALAAARVYFARPSDKADITAGSGPFKLMRADGAQEYASLYNPYWQAGLANASTVKLGGVSAKSALYTALGQPGLNCVSDPASCKP